MTFKNLKIMAFVLSLLVITGCTPFYSSGSYIGKGPLDGNQLVLAAGGKEALEDYIAQQAGALQVSQAPPPNRQEQRGRRPVSNAEWILGHWFWGGSGWSWRNGYWHTGYKPGRWNNGSWARRGGNWAWQLGYWDRQDEILAATALSYLIAKSAPPSYRLSLDRASRPSPRHTWLDGYWHWGQRSWEWVNGNWQIPRTNCVYKEPRWTPYNRGQWRSERPGWVCR